MAASHLHRPPPSLGPGRDAWSMESPELFGIPSASLAMAAQRLAKALPVRYCFVVALNGHLIHETTYHNATQTLYEADSLAKTMTAQIVGVAHHKGLIDLDKPLAQYGVRPRCPTMSMNNAARARCEAVLRTACPRVAPPFDCRQKSDAMPKLPVSRQCTEGCLDEPSVQAALRASNCTVAEARQWCAIPPGEDGCWVDCHTGKSYWPLVTARHLLTQTSGVGLFAPGSAWTYDSYVYISHLAYLISHVTNESSASWAAREYAAPMGLPDDLFAVYTKFSPSNFNDVLCGRPLGSNPSHTRPPAASALTPGADCQPAPFALALSQTARSSRQEAGR